MPEVTDDAIRAYAENLSVDELIGQVRAFIGVFEAVNGPVELGPDEEAELAFEAGILSDEALIAEAKRALADIGAL